MYLHVYNMYILVMCMARYTVLPTNPLSWLLQKADPSARSSRKRLDMEPSGFWVGIGIQG